MFDRAVVSNRKRGLIMRLICCALVIAGAFLTDGGTAPALKTVEDSRILRLHIIANSDSSYDQQVKLQVRDAVLAAHATLFAECDSLAVALDSVRRALPDILDTARATAHNAGFTGEVSASVGEFAFPDKVYGDTIVPAGKYSALRIELGAATGHNWWCILYPGMCAPATSVPVYAAVPSSAQPPEAAQSITFHSATLEWLRDLFS